MARLPAVIVCLLLALPAAARAGTASVEARCVEEPKALPACTSVMTYTAAAGEANAVELEAGVAGEHVLRDAGAPVIAGPGCTALSENEVACDLDAALLLLLDGDDQATVKTANAVTVDGGEGDDAIFAGPLGGLVRGGAGADVLSGGPGRDTLDGGPGPDIVFGGAGADRMVDGDAREVATSDVLDGGEGADVVSYVSRSRPVLVDLSREDGQGGEGEDDVLRSVEAAEGGAGDDTLLGGAGPDDLRGGGGEDSVRGRAGDDVLAGGEGADRIEGGGGRDRISLYAVAGGGADSVECGGDRDAVEDTDVRDLLAADCERIHTPVLEFLALRAQPTVRREWLGFRVPCPGTVEGCAGTVTVTRPGGRPARVRYSRPPGDRDRYLRLRVPTATTRPLRGEVVEVRLADDYGDVCPRPCGWRVRIP